MHNHRHVDHRGRGVYRAPYLRLAVYKRRRGAACVHRAVHRYAVPYGEAHRLHETSPQPPHPRHDEGGRPGPNRQGDLPRHGHLPPQRVPRLHSRHQRRVEVQRRHRHVSTPVAQLPSEPRVAVQPRPNGGHLHSAVVGIPVVYAQRHPPHNPQVERAVYPKHGGGVVRNRQLVVLHLLNAVPKRPGLHRVPRPKHHPAPLRDPQRLRPHLQHHLKNTGPRGGGAGRLGRGLSALKLHAHVDVLSGEVERQLVQPHVAGVLRQIHPLPAEEEKISRRLEESRLPRREGRQRDGQSRGVPHISHLSSPATRRAPAGRRRSATRRRLGTPPG